MRESLRQLLQQITYQLLAFAQIDEQIFGAWQKRLFNIDDGDLVGLTIAFGNAVKMHGRIVSNKADLCSSIAGQLFQMFGQSNAQNVQVSGLHSNLGDVQQKQINCRLWRTELFSDEYSV